jgi:hypothetical protein
VIGNIFLPDDPGDLEELMDKVLRALSTAWALDCPVAEPEELN